MIAAWVAIAAMAIGSGQVSSPCPSAAYQVDAASHAYGEDREFEALDLYLPHGARNGPLVVYIHGGAWVSGDKSDYARLGQAFARCGIAAAIVNYPLAPQTPAAQQAEKVGAAARWLAARAGEFGFDPARTFLVGHSAGAQLAWFALVNGLVSRTHIAGLVAIAPVGINPSSDVGALDPRYQGIYDPAFGADRSQWARFDIQPKLHGHEPPSMVIHGRLDTMAPAALARQLYDQLKAAGDSVLYVEPEDRSHWDIIEGLSSPGDPTMSAIERFTLSARALPTAER